MAVSLERKTGIVALLYWIWDGVDRTIFTAIKFSFPARFVSPFGFLGMLTFTVFIILGVSGALLMFYYQPILDRAWDSVEFINDENYINSNMIFDLFGRPTFLSSNKIILFRNSKGNFYKKFIVE